MRKDSGRTGRPTSRGRPTRCRAGLLLAVLAVGGAAGCGSSGATASAGTSGELPQGKEAIHLDPADFTTHVTNPYWPMQAGDRWRYEQTDGKGVVSRAETTVLQQTRTVGGIEALVVRDTLHDDKGALVEDTTDWYAQDSAGNIWYLGEKTAEYKNGQVVSTAGSWEAGVDGAQAGVIVPANPQPGTEYRQEFLAGAAEDQADVLSNAEQVQTPTGLYKGALLTRDTTALEPDLVELKWYARGVGPVLTLTPSGDVSRQVLVQTPGH